MAFQTQQRNAASNARLAELGDGDDLGRRSQRHFRLPRERRGAGGERGPASPTSGTLQRSPGSRHHPLSHRGGHREAWQTVRAHRGQPDLRG